MVILFKTYTRGLLHNKPRISFGKLSHLKAHQPDSFQSLESLSKWSSSDFLAASQANRAHRAGPRWPASGKTRPEEGRGACFPSRSCWYCILMARRQWAEYPNATPGQLGDTEAGEGGRNKGLPLHTGQRRVLDGTSSPWEGLANTSPELC